MILHDWPDREAQSILSNLVPAAEKGAWIIIMDSVLPSPGSVPSSYERLQRVRDLTMMMTFNSHERSAEDWNELLQVTDRRFKLVQIKQPMDSLMAVMEVVLEEEK